MPKILITGAAGYIGQQLAAALVSDPSNHLILTDIILPPTPHGAKDLHNTTCTAADLCSPSSLSAILDHEELPETIYLLHGIMSSASEADFELGLRVNVQSTLSILEAIRKLATTRSQKIRVIYASSLAVYGPPFTGQLINESTLPTPSSSYGSQKLACETLINDYTRRNFIDGLILRFPTVTVRAGKPTGAASSFISGIIREPLNGLECIVPIEDRAYDSWVCSPSVLIRNCVKARGIEEAELKAKLGLNRRCNLPGSTVSVGQMLDVLEKYGGKEAVGLVKEVADPGQEVILRSWASVFDTQLAERLGFEKDGGFEKAVQEFVEGMKKS